ncbi:MAG: hypothetical protein FWG78_04580 [Coriobacteriia bacterium]|nr:hypothetical protein [Coriobacteriia bacterium]
MMDTGSVARGIAHKRPQESVGYCVYCNKLVRRTAQAACPNDEHPGEGVQGIMWLSEDEPVPVLPKFHWGAFFMPPIWGAAHGVVIAGLVVLPLWLFLDNNIQSAVYRVGAATPFWTRMGVYFLTVFCTLASIALMTWFGRTAWGLSWRREYHDGTSSRTFENFMRRERIWYWICIVLFILLLGVALYYWQAVLPGEFLEPLT